MEPLKEEVRKMLTNKNIELEKKMKMVDAVERLGIHYFYEKEIDESVSQIFEEISEINFNIDYDLHSTASQFRIFRQHGHNIPCDVFKKLFDDEGKMKESPKNDIKGMVSLYEACHLRGHGETILDDTLACTTKFLESIVSVSEQARHALKQVSHFGIQRVESRHYILKEDEHLHDMENGRTCILGTSNSCSSLLSQDSSAVSLLKDLYSASAEDNETVCCFLDFQDSRLPPMKTRKPLTDLLVFGQAAQSASQKPSSRKEIVFFPLGKGTSDHVWESRSFLIRFSFYEDDEFRNETLLTLAKLDFNRLQLLYRQELTSILRWWHDLDLKTKLPYARQRCVECHFWAIAMYFEPQYSAARKLLVRVLLAISILDDTYDAYATFEEIQQLTQAFERMDLNAMNEFPEEYMKIVFQFVYDVYEHISKEMSKKGTPYAAQYAKDCVMDLIRAYHTEAEWYKAKHVPTFEEFMVNARITGVCQIIVTSSIIGMDEIVDEKPFQLISQAPKAIRAGQVIGRLMDDIVSHQEEQARGHVASGVECYMKEHNASRDEAVAMINRMLEDAWKEINEELFLVKANPNEDHLPKVVLQRILELSRVVDALYKVIDGYTYSAKLIKEDIITTYLRPITM
ncbi:valerianol synthase TPS8-like [Silene latifolia]|uniref:valerianol synthase TPS8-like n=1 Tax=Silene latifolia TaxID=37657 RepID=UPI003D789E92